MAGMKPLFFEGAQKTGTAPDVIEWLWSVNEASADYSFNRSHAACYALIAYRTAWLKANYPAEYMAALISSVMSTKDKVPFFVSRCEEMGIQVLPPDVNESGHDFLVVEGNIRFGLDAVKNVGFAAVEAIIEAREEGGPITSIWDFCERVDCSRVNKKAIESLIKCGALDSTGSTRWGMLSALEQALSYGQRLQADRMMGQDSLFGGTDEKPTHPPIGTEEYEKPELLRLEKETLGVYVSEHPLTGIRDQLRRKTDCNLSDLERRRDGEVVTVGGIVATVKQLTTKRGDAMVFLRLEDVTGGAECVVFNSTYASARELCVTDRILIVKGRVDHKEGETKLIALEVAGFEAIPERRDVRLKIDARQARAGVIRELALIVKEFRGAAPVLIQMETSEGSRTLQFGPDFRVEPAPDFFAEVKALLGPAAVL
jgi:DNA polymerase-3 subunit alpha